MSGAKIRPERKKQKMPMRPHKTRSSDRRDLWSAYFCVLIPTLVFAAKIVELPTTHPQPLLLLAAAVANRTITFFGKH